MESDPRNSDLASAADEGKPAPAAVKAASVWVNHLARTLKTCRMYTAGNATTEQFRSDLFRGLKDLLVAQDKLVLRFTESDVFLGTHSLYPARSREDNLGFPFYRDGIRSLTFLPGIESQEVDALVDALLHATGRNAEATDEDLVTRLWDARLTNVLIDYLPIQGEIDAAAGEAESAESRVPPWPASGGSAPPPDDAAAPSPDTRSDDWTTLPSLGPVEEVFRDLDGRSAPLLSAYRKEQEQAEKVPTLSAMLTLMRDTLGAEPTPADRIELGRFIPRLLREAMMAGAWGEASRALRLLSACETHEWSVDAFAKELLEPHSVITAKVRLLLEEQEPADLEAFLLLGRELGAGSIEWLMGLLADTDRRRVRQQLARTVADMCRNNPERLAPWVADARWYLARNTVYILGLIGTPAVAGLLAAAARHSELRVRREVAVALAGVEASAARPVLWTFLGDADSSLVCAAVEGLATRRDPELETWILKRVRDPGFKNRADREQEAMIAALGAVGGEASLEELEAQLLSGGWFARGKESRRSLVARAIARLGVPSARAVLEKGARSLRADVRAACQQALAGEGADA